MSRLSNTPTLYTAQKTVTTSGTPVQLASKLIPDGAALIVKAKTSNTGTITVGFSSSTALNSGTSHLKLTPGVAVAIQVRNADAIWIDATVSSEGVELLVEADH